MNNNSGNSFLAFLAGIATGAVLGILYAPDKGQNTRDKLSYQLDKYKETLQQILDDLVEGKNEYVSEAKSEGEKVVSDAFKQAEKLMSEVDALKKQISGNQD